MPEVPAGKGLHQDPSTLLQEQEIRTSSAVFSETDASADLPLETRNVCSLACPFSRKCLTASWQYHIYYLNVSLEICSGMQWGAHSRQAAKSMHGGRVPSAFPDVLLQ